MRRSLILGGGPGGTGPLVWAAQNGKLAEWLSSGISILDRSDVIGGNLGRYAVNSDSLGSTYLECLDAPAARELFAPMREEEVTRELETMRYALPPLHLVGCYFRRFGALLRNVIECSGASEFLPHTTAQALHLREDGSVAAEVVMPSGGMEIIEARTAIMALGGHQDMAAWLAAPLLPDVRLAEVEPEKIMSSDTLLTAEGLARAAALLARAPRPRVIILGGSHSAFSAAWVLTHLLPQVDFGPGEISILLRRAPRIFYWTKAEAEADGYPVTERDLCVRTKRVNRLGGLRGDGREMWRRLTGRPGALPEARVGMIPLTEAQFPGGALRRALDEAALVVPAFGYRSATVPVFDPKGRRLWLQADLGGRAVGRDARVLLADGGHLPNVFGIGLGADYRPWGRMGGEPSLDSQANSLWLYQNDIGEVVYQGVRECVEEDRPLSPFMVEGRLAAGLA